MLVMDGADRLAGLGLTRLRERAGEGGSPWFGGDPDDAARAGLPSSRELGYSVGPALLAQLVEHFHGKEGVDGSSPSEGL